MEKNNQAVVEKTDKKAQKKNPNKKPNVFVRLWGKIKAVASELKKVTWPTFPTVLKQLGCVLVTVLIMLALILVIDLGETKVRMPRGFISGTYDPKAMNKANEAAPAEKK